MDNSVGPISEHSAPESPQKVPIAWISSAAFWLPQHIVNSAWLEHGSFAFWLVEAIRPRTLIELGTHNGFSYFCFCQAVQWLRLSTSCHAVDTWLGDEHAGFYGEQVYSLVSGVNDQRFSGFSRLMRCRFDEALPYFEDGTVDLLHVDGRHHANDVEQDYESWRPKLSSRGVVLFHDINVREREFGVWRIWAKLSAKYPSFSFIHGNGLGVLAVGPDIPVGLRPLLEAGPGETDLIRSAYARLGLAIRRQYELEFTHCDLGETAAERDHLKHERQAVEAERDRLRGENQALLTERDHLKHERQAVEGECDRLRGENQALLAEQDEREHAFRDAAAALQVSNVRLGDVEKAQVDLLASLDRQRDAADEQARAMTEIRGALARETHNAQAAWAYAQCIERSTLWRATLPLREILDWIPPRVRLTARRSAKLLWWAATPHRMQARIIFLRARRRSESLPTLTHEASEPVIVGDGGHFSTLTETPIKQQPNEPGIIGNPGSDWFDAEYYLNQDPRLENLNVDPFTHYATIGWRMGRNPHPLFDVRWWLNHQLPNAGSDVEPLQHFLSQMGSVPTVLAGCPPRGWSRSARDYGDVPTCMPMPYTPPGRGRFDGTAGAVVFGRLEEVDILSLDIFDTALIRRVAHPTSVFDLMEATACAIHPQLGNFADLRFWAEREARTIAQRKTGTPEIGFRQIYDVIQKELMLSDSERQQLERLELDVERKVLRANPTVLGWYQKALATGKKTIFVSDMYLPSTFLTEVLCSAGYKDPVVYVSNEHGVGKWQCALYEKVASDLGISGKKILHLGDNFQADVQSAVAAGWNAVHYVEHEAERPFGLQMADLSALDISNIAVSLSLGLSRVHRVGIAAADLDPAERIARHVGYEVVGPTALAFAGWIATRARADRLDKVLFLARDGFLFQNIYELLREYGFGVCDSKYVAASRRLLYNQRLLTIEGLTNFVSTLNFSRETTLYDYMDIFQITNDDIIAHCANKLGISDSNAPVLHQLSACGDYDLAKRVLAKTITDLAPMVTDLAHEASKTLLRYYQEASGIENSRDIGLVDLGWSGSVLPSLKSIFESIAPSAALRTYFFGLIENRKNHMPADMRLDAYFFLDAQFEQYKPFRVPSVRQHAAVIGASPSLMEILLGENTTTAIGLQPDYATGALQIVRSKDTYSTDQRRLVAIMHEEALKFARETVEMLGANPARWKLRSLIAQSWNRLLSSPDVEEAGLLGAFPHRADASGRSATATLVSSHSCNGESVLTELASVQWPAGWFALLPLSKRVAALEQLNSEI